MYTLTYMSMLIFLPFSPLPSLFRSMKLSTILTSYVACLTLMPWMVRSTWSPTSMSFASGSGTFAVVPQAQAPVRVVASPLMSGKRFVFQ